MTPDLASTARPPLGRRLFEEEPAWTVLPTVLMVSGSLLLVLLAVAVQREGLRMPQMELGGLAIALIALGVHLQYVRVTIHENGVLRTTVLRRRELLFEDVAAVQQWGSKIRLLPAEGGKPFTLRTSPEAKDLRDRLAMGFEERLFQQLGEKGEVPWASNIWLSRAGIHWRSAQEGENLVPLYSSIRITVDPSYCRVHHPSWNLVPLLSTAGENFLPGLLLLQRLIAQAPTEPHAANPTLHEPGRLLGEIRGRWVAPLLTLLIGLTLTGLSIKTWLGEKGDINGLPWWLILSWIALSALLQDRFEIHEHGLAIVPLLGRRRELAYAEIRGLRFFQEYLWFGTMNRFELLDSNGRTLQGRILTRNHDAAPGMLRDRIAEPVADSLLIRMKEEGVIRWGEDARLSREWIHGKDSSGIERSIPLSRGMRFTSDGVTLRLYRPGSSEPFVHLDMSQQDAYSGLLLLQRLIEEAEA